MLSFVRRSNIDIYLNTITTHAQVGVGICGDASKVYRDYNVCIKGMDDLSDLASKKIGGDKWGLASLSEALVCKEVSVSFSVLAILNF